MPSTSSSSSFSWSQRILLAALVALAVAFLPQYEAREREDLGRIEKERDELQASNQRLKAEIDLLRAEVEELHLDPQDPASAERVQRVLARIAREDLNLIRPGEVVFELERSNDDSSQNIGKRSGRTTSTNAGKAQ